MHNLITILKSKKRPLKSNNKLSNIANRMINSIIDFLTSVTRPAVTSIASATTGTILTISEPTTQPLIETVLKYGAWSVAIVAGIVAIVNGIDNFCSKHRKEK